MRRGLDKTFLDNNLLRSPEFMALPASARGLWLQLQALCSSQENGGRLAGAAKWGNGAWRQAMGNGGGKAAFETLAGLNLAEVVGADVLVRGYHLECEAKYQAARVNGAKGGQASAARRGGAPKDEPGQGIPSEGQDSPEERSSDAQAALDRRSSAQGEGGEAKKGNAKEGDVGRGDVPEGSTAAGEARLSALPRIGPMEAPHESEGYMGSSPVFRRKVERCGQ